MNEEKNERYSKLCNLKEWSIAYLNRQPVVEFEYSFIKAKLVQLVIKNYYTISKEIKL